MPNIFDHPALARGYASARPGIHPLVMNRVKSTLPVTLPVQTALDLGCGAGLSTVPLLDWAQRCFGVDPAEQMVAVARRRVPQATFFVAPAESIPLDSQSVDLISAAGSLNYADLPQFFAEACRVLRYPGLIVAYDFFPGRAFSDDLSLGEWFQQFGSRYPWPPSNGKALSPEILACADTRFTLHSQERFKIPLPMSQSAYLAYMLTETNVALAVENGTRREDVQAWCASTLAPLFGTKARNVVFDGYFACLRFA